MKLDWLHQIMMGPTHCDEAKRTPPFADSSISSKRLSYQDELIMSEKLSEAHLLKRRTRCIFFFFFGTIQMSECYFLLHDC